MSEKDIASVIQVFRDNDARWALVGAHAIGLLTEPRATTDFDFIVEGSKLGSVIGGLTTCFGDLGENDIGAAIQLKAIDVDLIRSSNHPLFQVALEHVRTIGAWMVPRTEVLIVLKFLSAVSPWRSKGKRIQDVADIVLIRHGASAALDRELMMKLAGMVYPGAEDEFGDLLGRIDRGEPVSI